MAVIQSSPTVGVQRPLPVVPQALLVGPTELRESGAGGLHIDVPAGWSALRSHVPGSFAHLVHADTGIVVRVRVFASAASPSPWSNCLDQASDAVGRYRVVPAIYPATARTCIAQEASDPLRKGWYGTLDGRTVHVEAELPPGTFVLADDVLSDVLQSLSVD